VLKELHAGNDQGLVNTDTVMLLHIPSGGGQATVISFPRDSWIDIPGYGKGKLNSAYAVGAAHGGGDTGGMKTLIGVVETLSGLHVDHFVKVSLLGFYEIAKALGPIQVCLKQPAKDPYSGVDLPAGVSTLDAKEALAFVRQRHHLPRGDLDREVRQQYFLSVELQKVQSTGVLLNPGRLHHVLTAVAGALETDPGLDLLQFATEFKGVSAGKVRFATIPTTGTPTITTSSGTRVSIVSVDFTALPAFVAQVVGEPSEYTSASAANPADVTVKVVNGTGTPGLAASTARTLQGLGFHIAGTGNTDGTTRLTTVTYPAGKEAEAKALAAQVPGAVVARSSSVSQVTLTLGTDGRRPATAQSGATAGSGSSSPSAPASSSAQPRSPAKSFAQGSCIN
jgi:LCP family protein required for cell wall assembly